MSRKMGYSGRHKRRAVAVVGFAVAMVLVGAPGSVQAKESSGHGSRDDDSRFHQVNLVSDIPHLAQLTDPAVINPWGISFGPKTPLWVANNGVQPGKTKSLITLYSGANAQTAAVTRLGLAVEADSPTGTVFNNTDGFKVSQNGQLAASAFLFNENLFDATGFPTGEISGWHNTTPAPPTTTVVKVKTPGAFYTGLALLETSHEPRLLAADAAGKIDVFDANFQPVTLPAGAFVDKSVKSLTPYNVAVFGDRVYVTYADPAQPIGAISVFTKQGRLIKSLVKVGKRSNHLDGPWGLAVAPERWGDFGGDLLVGNVGDGRINAYDPRSGEFEGTLKDEHGHDIVNVGLWGLEFGNGVIGTPQTLVFAAGIGNNPHDAVNEYAHGLVGLIVPRHQDDD